MQKKLKRIKAYTADNWKLGLLVTFGVGIVSTLLLYKLGSLTGGLSADEFANQQQLAANNIGLESIARLPFFLPYWLVVYILEQTSFSGPTAVRATGALFGLLGGFGMFYILKSWYSVRIAVLGTILFVTSSWLLHSARYASPESTYLLIPLLIASMVALQARTRAKLAVLAVVAFGMSAFYIPGMVWFFLPALYIKRKVIIKALRLQPKWFIGAVALMAVIALIPFVYMLVKPLYGYTTATNIFNLLGLPTSGFPSPIELINVLKDTLTSIFAYSNMGPVYTVGHVPWLDICSVVLVILGLYQFAKQYKLDRSKLMAIATVISFVLISLGGAVSMIILLPLIYLLIAEGLKWLLDSWLGVFPRNPFARGFAVIMVTLLVVSIAGYQLNKYFLAWGRSPETRQVFNQIP